MNRWVRSTSLWAGLVILAVSVQASELQQISANVDDGKARLVLTGASDFANPSVFTTESPPRLVIDLPGTASVLDAAKVPVDAGPLLAYQALSAGGRTRVVVDLDSLLPYEIEMVGSTLTVVMDAAGTADSQISSLNTANAGSNAATVQAIDFRRSPDGGGRVIVDLDRTGANLTVSERSTGLRIDILGARLAEDQFRRLDVVDFATPVQMIIPEQRGNNTRLFLEIAGAFEHLAYQSGGQIVVDVSRPVEEVVEDSRELQFFGEREYSGDRITLNFQDIEVRSVLQLLAEVSDRNIVVSDSVGGSLTLRLTDVPWDQALDIVLETKNLDMRESGNVTWIAPIEEIAAREQQVLRARADRQTLEPLRTVMLPISYAKATDLAALVSVSQGDETGMLSARGSVSVDERTNTLLVTDTIDRIDEVRGLVTELDKPVRQVHIESRIVIARHDFNYELGVRFGVTGARQDSRGNLYTASGSSVANETMINSGLVNRRSGRGTSTPVDLPGLDDRLNVNLPVSSAAGSLGVSILAADYMLDLELSALETEGRGEVISTPRIITANQTEAFIQQGVELPYESLQGGNQAGAVNIEFKEAVLELRATPLITPDNRVQLDLQIKQDTVGEIFETGRGGSVPSIDTREMATKVLVDNGQTVVLGGIFQEDRNLSTTKVPVLADVPVVGRLFRRRGNNDQKRELLIFITPSILDDRVVLD